MSTAKDIIKGSLRLIGAISQGKTPGASEISDGLSVLNDLVDSWSNENLMIPFKTIEEFDLVASQQDYTMGAGGDFNTTWPIELISAYYQDNASTPKLEIPVKTLSHAEWGRISNKGVESSIPQALYVIDDYPLKTLKFYPVPNIAKKIVLYSLKPLMSFTEATTVMVLPPGYGRALKYNLALEIAPEYGVDPSGLVLKTAGESKSALKSKNIKPVYMRSDAALLTNKGGFNFRTGE